MIISNSVSPQQGEPVSKVTAKTERAAFLRPQCWRTTQGIFSSMSRRLRNLPPLGTRGEISRAEELPHLEIFKNSHPVPLYPATTFDPSSTRDQGREPMPLSREEIRNNVEEVVALKPNVAKEDASCYQEYSPFVSLLDVCRLKE